MSVKLASVFDVGDIVTIKLTGECGMVLDKFISDDTGYKNGYVVRRQSNMDTIKMYDFELMVRVNQEFDCRFEEEEYTWKKVLEDEREKK